MIDREVVIVTGAAGGIGRAYAAGLVREEYAVVVADIVDTAEIVRELEQLGGIVLPVHVDIRSHQDTEAMAKAVLERFGRIDALVNNAAYFTRIHKRPFEEIPIGEWDEVFAVNVRGSWLCARAVAPAMKAQHHGKIVNTSSMTVPSGIPYFLHYVASKAAIVGMTRALARELGEWNITVNTLSPDYIPHDAEYAGRQPEMAGVIAAQRCLKRDQVPEDLIGTLLYLIGHGSDFVTGQNLLVNGGRLFS